jgi:hypothetical protein
MNHTQHISVKRLAELATHFAKLSIDMVEMTTSLLVEPPIADATETTRFDPAAPTSPTSPSEPPRRKAASKDEVLASVKAVRDVIGNKNRPMQINALFQEISALGFVIDTPKPILTFGARLRDHRTPANLIYLKGFGWWLAERPYPAANYIPPNVTRIGKHII